MASPRISSVLLGSLLLVCWTGLAAAQDVDDLVSRLRAGGDQRLEALAALGDLGAKAAPAIPELAKLLRSSDSDLRLEAAAVLARMGEPGLPALGSALEERASVRLAAVNGLALTRAAQRGEGQVRLLLRALHDEDARVREAATYGLSGVEEATPELLRILGEDRRGEVRAGALRALGELDAPSPDLVEAMLAAVGDPATINVAGAVLQELGPLQPEQLRALRDLLDHPNPQVATSAAFALAHCGDPAIPVLLDALKDPREQTRYHALMSLSMNPGYSAGLEPHRREAYIDGIVLALEDPAVSVRAAAASALGSYTERGPPPELLARTLWPLAKARRASDADVEAACEHALEATGYRLSVAGARPVWVVGAAFWPEWLGLLLVLVVAFALTDRFPRQRPQSLPGRAAFLLALGGSSCALAGLVCADLLTEPWLKYYLPGDGLLLIPVPAAAALTAAVPCLLATTWVWVRKPSSPEAV